MISNVECDCKQDILLSLCIPTNGMTEWVVPVLESIYAQKVPESLYEVIIADNGDNEEFEEAIHEYSTRHENLKYARTKAKGFLNQIESFKMAQGAMIKFVNHRMCLRRGALTYLIQFVDRYIQDKPIVYFLNGTYQEEKAIKKYICFDKFVDGLGCHSSWSGGLAIWKIHFDQMKDRVSYNALFPHIDILFNQIEADQYIVDQTQIFESVSENHAKKGTYNLFRAFAVEYMIILFKLWQQGNISLDTFISVKNDTRKFIEGLYLDFIILKRPCSYELENKEQYINVFFDCDDMEKCIKRNFIGKIIRYRIKAWIRKRMT